MVGTRVLQATADLVEISALAGRGAITRTAFETALDPDAVDGRIKIAAVLAELLQRDMELWIHIDDLPADEETIGMNANAMQARFGDGLRWERVGPDRWLVAREDTITVTWDDVDLEYNVTIRGAR